MAATKNPKVRLLHIVDEAEAIRQAIAELTFEDFQNSWTVRRAVEHALLIITEASKALPSELKSAESGVPWARVEAFGNVLRHEYKEVESEVVWRIVHEQLPMLLAAARNMLENLDGQ
jgi:uncharacterized protein with HEPN domain